MTVADTSQPHAIPWGISLLPGGCWPTPAQEQLLQAALLDEPSQIEAAWLAWQQQIDMNTIDLGSQNLLPLVFSNLRRHGLEIDQHGLLQGIRRQRFLKSQLLFAAIGNVLQELQKAGVQTMLLKGAALVAGHYYSGSSLRPMNDVDLLVRPEDVTTTLELLLKQGWGWKLPRQQTHYFATDPQFIPYRFLSIALQDSNHHEIDLHWWLLPQQDLWRHARAATFQGHPTFIPSPEDLLLHICDHGLEWNAIPPLRWVADSVMILRRDQGLDWQTLVDQSLRSQRNLSLKLGLTYLNALIPNSIPANVLQHLQDSPTSWQQRLTIWGKTQPRLLFKTFPRAWLGFQPHYQSYCATFKPEDRPTFLQFFQQIWGLQSPVSAAQYIGKTLWMQIRKRKQS